MAILASFAAAQCDLIDQDRHRWRDVVVPLAEDHGTEMLYAPWDDDAATVFSSFMLSETVADEDFDANFHRE